MAFIHYSSGPLWIALLSHVLKETDFVLYSKQVTSTGLKKNTVSLLYPDFLLLQTACHEVQIWYIECDFVNCYTKLYLSQAYKRIESSYIVKYYFSSPLAGT